MSRKITRRELLVRGLGATGIIAAGPALAARAGEPAARERPDRSAEAPSAPVAIERCESFDPPLLRRALDAAFDRIGGIQSLVRGKTVTVKVNLTGLEWKPVFGMPARETYQTHPATVAALCAALDAAGVRRIVIVENLYWDRPMEQSLAGSGWDLGAIRSAGGQEVAFEDTRNRGAFPGYSRFRVPWGGFIYPAFDMNQRFEKTDVLVSLAKLKQHATAGVTGAVKNLFGNTPSSVYGDDGPGEGALSHRAAMFHGGNKKPPAGAPQELAHGTPRRGAVRVPRITADIFGARPSDLNIVEGIRSISGGEGHWNEGIALVEPKVLLVGRNAVSTDAIATAVMGFDPMAPHGKPPFPGDNHLRLLASVGVGTNDPARIEVRGLPLKDALHPFERPAAKSG